MRNETRARLGLALVLLVAAPLVVALLTSSSAHVQVTATAADPELPNTVGHYLASLKEASIGPTEEEGPASGAEAAYVERA